jgi:hypothetical protein
VSRCTIALVAGRCHVRFKLDDEASFYAALEDLKETIPPSRREWQPWGKTWVVDAGYRDRLRDWAYRHFDAGDVVFERPAAPPPRPELDPDGGPWETLWLRPGAPEYVIRAVFRAMAQRHHPDHGGDEMTMKRLNNAFEALTKGAA